jgi:hypothetical protein
VSLRPDNVWRCVNGAITFSLTTLCLTTPWGATKKYDTQSKESQCLCVVIKPIYAECRYAECLHGECRGTTPTGVSS